jgi:hypothetical protein
MLKRIQEVDGCSDPFLSFVVGNEPINMEFGFGAKGDHTLLAVFGSACDGLAFIRAILARSLSRTGSSGTVWPAAICASLRSNDSTSQFGGVL